MRAKRPTLSLHRYVFLFYFFSLVSSSFHSSLFYFIYDIINHSRRNEQCVSRVASFHVVTYIFMRNGHLLHLIGALMVAAR